MLKFNQSQPQASQDQTGTPRTRPPAPPAHRTTRSPEATQARNSQLLVFIEIHVTLKTKHSQFKYNYVFNTIQI